MFVCKLLLVLIKLKEKLVYLVSRGNFVFQDIMQNAYHRRGLPFLYHFH